MTVVKGDLSISKAGAVMEGKDIRGCVVVKAPNVTIRRSKVTCSGYYAIGSFAETYKGGGLLLEDVEVDCRNRNATAVGSYGMTARRLNIHGCENGFDIDDTTTVVDSYIHDLYEGATGHADGIQLAGGSNIRIKHNTIYAPGGTSAIISHPTKNANVLVEDNLLAGGAYTLYCPRERSRDYRVIANRFARTFSAKGGAYGAWTGCEKTAAARDNFWDNTLKPL
ncbi:right-handed parallel beta-helix repeat-containing protein [Nonomuraea sp. NPDC046802]|uniref:right-handed parallel beta-helix repeat-containing protein n=1 Tax=Nonomuraea sp. NPDC046802 TaxID=3154919 RepID=UPI0033C1ABE5